jgi:DNA-binding transcriptional LysR family regulator
MELRHLRYFVAVAEELHFRRAAERLHVAQPAVSDQIRKLEAELGVTLLYRTKRSVALTAPGAALLEEARRVLRQADVAARAAQSAREQELGRLRVGYLVDALPTCIPQALAAFRDAAPGIEVLLESGPSLRLAADVRREVLDLAIVCLPTAVGDLRMTSLGEESAICAVPAGDRLADRHSLAPEEIGERPLVLLPRVQNPAFYDGVISTWRAADLMPTPIEATEPHVVHALLAVAAGTGIAILPASAAQRASVPGVRLLPLEPGPTCEIAVISRDEASTTVAGFITLATRFARFGARRDRLALLAA